MIPFRLKALLCLVLVNWSFTPVDSDKLNKCADCEVSDLSGESSFRTVKLSWNYFHEPDPVGFNVKFCELSIWNTNVRCRERLLRLNNGRLRNKINLLNKVNSPIEPLNSGELITLKQRASIPTYDKLIRKNKHHYEALIYDLRTLTNYTFQVTAEQQLDSAQSATISTNSSPIQNLIKHNLKDKALAIKSSTSLDENVKSIQIETKGFSARTERCLSNSSDVVINTGPLFNGKISVENASDECAVYGNRSYTQETYHLTILHDKCGSRTMNNSRIETMIIVHENKDILTHNARRFLVVCSFLPEPYVLKASVSMPTSLLRRKGPQINNQFSNQLNNQQQFNNQQSHTLYSVSRVDPASIDNLFANESRIVQNQQEFKRNKRPTIINRINRNHPGTLQEQFYKQKQQYLNSYLLNRQPNNTEINNEVVYNFEKLTKNGNNRDARILLSNQPQHSIVYNTHHRDRQNAQFQNYFTMTMVAVGSTCLFVIIIFNFISIPKIWSNQSEYYRRRHHHHQHYYKEQKKEQEGRSRRHREYRDYRLSLNKQYPSSFNSLSSSVSSNVASSYQQDISYPYNKPKTNKPLKTHLNRYSSSLSPSSSFSSV